MSKICRFCGKPVTVNEDYYDVFEGMHWLCFHLNFEHGEYDYDEPCDDPSCPWNKIGHGFFSDEKICDLYIESSDRRSSIEIIFGETEKNYLPNVAIDYRLTGDISFKHRKKVWVEIENLSEFINELTILGDKGRGKATLRSMSPDEFEIVFENADNSGHIILFYTLSNSHSLYGKRVNSVTRGGFELEIQALPTIINTFSKLLEKES